MELNTSLGYPLGAYFPSQKKKHFFNTTESGERKMTEVLEKDYIQAEKELLAGNCELMLMIESLKDEIKPIEKAHKTRVFSVPPLISIMLCRKFTLMYCAYLMFNHVDCEVAAGINVHSASWERLRKRLAKFVKLLAGDYIHWDKSLVYQMAIRFSAVMNSWYGSESPQENRARYILCCAAFSSIRQVRGRWLRQSGMPSGISFTTVGNSIINSLIINTAFFHYCKKEGMKMDRALSIRCSDVEATFYGDDHVVSLSERAAGFLNMLKLKQFLNEAFGMNYTDAAKNEVVDMFTNWNDVTYLKRKWVIRESFTAAPLPLSVIEQIPNWANKGIDPVEFLECALTSFCIELGHWDQKTYEEKVEVVRKVLIRKKLPVNLMSFSEARDFVHSGLHRDQVFKKRFLIELLNELIQAEAHHIISTKRDKFGLPTSVDWCPQYGALNTEKHHKCKQCGRRALTLLRLDDGGRACFECVPVIPSEQVPSWYFHDTESCARCKKEIPNVAHAEMERSEENDADMLTKSEKPTLFEDVAVHKTTALEDPQMDFPSFESQQLDLVNFFSRPILVNELTWVDDDISLGPAIGGTSSKVASIPVTYALMNLEVVRDKLKNIGFFRGNIKMEVRINSSQMYYGLVQVSYMPYARAVNEVQNGKSTSPYMNVVTQSGCNAQILSANQGETLEFDLGWPLNKEFIWMKDFESEDRSRSVDLGALYFFMLTPLKSASLETATATIQVFVRLDNPHFGGFSTYTSALLDTPKYLSWVEYADILDLSGPTFYRDVTNPNNPSIEYIVPVSEGFSKTKRKVKFTSKNCDDRKVVMDEFSTSGSKHFPKGSLTNAASLSPLGKKHTIAEIAGSYSIVRMASIVVSAAPKVVMASYVTPAEFPALDTTNSVKTLFMTQDASVASTCKFWRGDAVYKVCFVSSTFFSFRARISWEPVKGEGVDTLIQGGNKHSKVVDVRGTTTIEFTVPYIRDTPYIMYGTENANWQTNNGMVSVEIISKVSHPFSDTDPTVYVVMWRKFENFQVGRPCGDFLGALDRTIVRNKSTPTQDQEPWCPVHTYGGGNNPNPPLPTKLEFNAVKTLFEYNVLSSSLFSFDFALVKPSETTKKDDPIPNIISIVSTDSDGHFYVPFAPQSPAYVVAPSAVNNVTYTNGKTVWFEDTQVRKITTDCVNIKVAAIADGKWADNKRSGYFDVHMYDDEGTLIQDMSKNQTDIQLFRTEVYPQYLLYQAYSPIYYVGGTPDTPKTVTFRVYFVANAMENTPDFHWVYVSYNWKGMNYLPLHGVSNLSALINAQLSISCYNDYLNLHDTAPRVNFYDSPIGNNFDHALTVNSTESKGIITINVNGQERLGAHPARSWYKVHFWATSLVPLNVDMRGTGSNPPQQVSYKDECENSISNKWASVSSCRLFTCANFVLPQSTHPFGFEFKIVLNDYTSDNPVFYNITIELLPDVIEIAQSAQAELYEDGLAMPESIETIEQLAGRFGQVALLPPAIFQNELNNISVDCWLIDLETTTFANYLVYSPLAKTLRTWYSLVTRQSMPFRRYFMQMFRMVRGSTDVLVVPSSNSYHNWQACVVTNNYLGDYLSKTFNSGYVCGYVQNFFKGYVTATPLLGGTPTCATSAIQFNQATNISGLSINVPYSSNMRMVPTAYGVVSNSIMKNQLILMNGDNDVSRTGMDDVAVRVFERTGDDFEYHMRVGMPRVYFDSNIWGQNLYKFMIRAVTP